MKSANAKQTLVCAYVNGRGLDFALGKTLMAAWKNLFRVGPDQELGNPTDPDRVSWHQTTEIPETWTVEFWSGGHGLGQWVRAKNELGEVVDL